MAKANMTITVELDEGDRELIKSLIAELRASRAYRWYSPYPGYPTYPQVWSGTSETTMPGQVDYNEEES